jgi:hypothetical protein
MIVRLSSIKGVDGQLKAPELEFEIADTTPTSSTIRIKHGGIKLLLFSMRNSGWLPAEMSPDGWCEACDRAEHIACAGVGNCECDLCVPYDLRGEAIAVARRKLNSARLCGNG